MKKKRINGQKRVTIWRIDAAMSKKMDSFLYRSRKMIVLNVQVTIWNQLFLVEWGLKFTKRKVPHVRFYKRLDKSDMKRTFSLFYRLSIIGIQYSFVKKQNNLA